LRETSKHRKAFDVYVRMGPARSLVELRAALRQQPGLVGLTRGPSLSSLEAWSSALHWQDRLADLEREARQRDEEEQIQALREMDESQIREGLALQQKGIERLNQIELEDLTANDAVRAVIEGVKLERLARGEPTEHIRQEGLSLHGHLNLNNFSLEELRRLAELADRSSSGNRQTEPE
jgi:hypothetical protein